MVRRPSAFARWLALIALLGFAGRVAYVAVFRMHTTFAGDSVYYTLGADLLAHGKGFINPLFPRFQTVPSASHPPLYMMWLAIAAYFRSASHGLDLVWSCVLGTGTIVVTGLAGREVAGKRAGLLTAGLAAVYPNIWLHDGELLSETMAMFTTALVIWLAYRFIRRPGALAIALLGLACGLAGLSRPELVLTAPVIMLPLALRASRDHLRRGLGLVAIGGAAALIVVGPWVGYNLTRFNKPVLLSSNLGATLAAANCNKVYYGTDIGFKSYVCLSQTSHKVLRPTMDESEDDAALRKAALHYVGAHAGRVPLVIAARWGRALEIFHPTEDVHEESNVNAPPWVAWAGEIMWYFVAVGAVLGAIVLRRRRRPLLPLLAIPAIVLISIATTFAQARYRAPAEIAVVILAAVAVDELLRRRTASSPQSKGANQGQLDDPTLATTTA